MINITKDQQSKPKCMICGVEFVKVGDYINFKYACECGIS